MRLGYRLIVKAKLWPFARRYAFDLLIVAAAVGGTVEMLTRYGEKQYLPSTSSWFLVPAVLAATLPLLARRRLPFGAPVATLAVIGSVSFVEGNFAPYSFSIFLTAIASAFLLGMVEDRRQAVAGLAVIYAVVAIATRNQPSGGAGDALFISIILSCAWLAGFALSQRLAQAREAEERAQRLAHQREEEARRAVEDERSRISRELHDVIAHSVSVMTVQAGAVRRLLRPDQEREREALLTVEETGRQALTEMRRLLGVLRREGETAALAPQPGIGTLDHLVEQVREAGLPVELTFEGERLDLPPGIDLSAYRIVQEALTNVLRHAGPARAWVAIRYGVDEVEVEVANDGRSNGTGESAGHGLVGMRERVALFGGELSAGPRIGGGYAINARLPISGPST